MKKENTPVIHTDRLTLRKFTFDDVDDMFLIYTDEEVNRFLPWFPFKSEDETQNYLRENIFADYEKDIAYRYAVVLKETRRVIGYVSINGIDPVKACGDLGYGLRKEFWNRGLITEASRAVLERLKSAGFRSVTATHDVNNPGSGRVMEKSGMSYRYSYDELWQPKNFWVTFRLYQIDFGDTPG